MACCRWARSPSGRLLGLLSRAVGQGEELLGVLLQRLAGQLGERPQQALPVLLPAPARSAAACRRCSTSAASRSFSASDGGERRPLGGQLGGLAPGGLAGLLEQRLGGAGVGRRPALAHGVHHEARGQPDHQADEPGPTTRPAVTAGHHPSLAGTSPSLWRCHRAVLHGRFPGQPGQRTGGVSHGTVARWSFRLGGSRRPPQAPPAPSRTARPASGHAGGRRRPPGRSVASRRAPRPSDLPPVAGRDRPDLRAGLRAGGRGHRRRHPRPAGRRPRGGQAAGPARRDGRRAHRRDRRRWPSEQLVDGDTTPDERRELVAVLRMLPDLDRNGDLAEHIARRAARGLGRRDVGPQPRAWSSAWARWPPTIWRSTADAFAERSVTGANVRRRPRRRAGRPPRHPHRRAGGRDHAAAGGHRAGHGGPLLRALRRPRRQPGPPHGGPGGRRPRAGAPRAPTEPGAEPVRTCRSSRASAICTALRAAPLRRLSPHDEQGQPVGAVGPPDPADERRVAAGAPSGVGRSASATPGRRAEQLGRPRSGERSRVELGDDGRRVAGEHRHPDAGAGRPGGRGARGSCGSRCGTSAPRRSRASRRRPASRRAAARCGRSVAGNFDGRRGSRPPRRRR